MKRIFLKIWNWCSQRIHDIIYWTSLALIGVGLGWWVHPGAGLMIMGLITLGLGVYGHEKGPQKETTDA